MIDQPWTVYESAGSRKSIPVSYAILKSANCLPLAPPPVVVVELLLPPPPPHALTTSASPAATTAAIATDLPRLVLTSVTPPGSRARSWPGRLDQLMGRSAHGEVLSIRTIS